MGTDSPPRQDGPPIVDEESSMARAEQSQTGNVPPTAGVEPSADESLFAADDLSGLRSRWDDVHAAFVDDPTECVQKADALVAEAVEQLTAGFSEARSRLEAQWAGGSSSRPEALPRVLPTAARGLRLFHTLQGATAATPISPPISPLSADEFPVAIGPPPIQDDGPRDLRLALECVLDLLAGVLEAGLRLVDFAIVLGVFISGHLAQSLFGFAAEVVGDTSGTVIRNPSRL